MQNVDDFFFGKVIDVDEADCAGQKKFVLDIFDTNISSRDLRLSQELINLRLAQCKDEQKLEVGVISLKPLLCNQFK